MLWKSKRLQIPQRSQHSLHQTNNQAKTKHKETLTTTKWVLKHLQHSKTPTPQDPLHNLKAIKFLGTSLAWAQTYWNSIGLEIRMHKQEHIHKGI